jgi:aminopeptidase-like protein
MAPDSGRDGTRSAEIGDRMHALARRLYPICRSITGDGLRETLRILAEGLPMSIEDVPSGTRVLDWQVPDEWNVRAAYIARLSGERIVDFADCNLHLVQYSLPMDRVVPVEELRAHLHTLPESPEWIPYRTAYYAKSWGFCLSHRVLESMSDPAYRVVIDATLEPGHLSYGELFLPGERQDEVLFSIHCCHPSLANDNLSGMAIARALAEWLTAQPRMLSYRFLFIPGTIGSITWLARNEAKIGRIKHGLVLSCLGDSGGMTYKKSRREDAAIDRAVAHVLEHTGRPFAIAPFVPYGYDERQYCSPGFDLPVGCLMRSPNGTFDEYHTSADNLDFVRPDHLADSLSVLQRVVDVLEGDGTFLNTNPKGEPQLGRRGLYRPVGGQKEAGGYDQLVLLWVLNLSDGRHTLLDIARRAGQPFAKVRAAADALIGAGLLTRVDADIKSSASAESSDS